jgi:hypothetical protein
MDTVWILYGYCMDTVWILYGYCMDRVWLWYPQWGHKKGIE